jgi:hypothetical protein
VAYPFGPPIPLATLIQQLCDHHGCELRVSEKAYRDTQSGEVERFRYLFRRTPDGNRVATLPEHTPTTEEMPSVVRSICTRLDVDYAMFGVLSDPSDDTDD